MTSFIRRPGRMFHAGQAFLAVLAPLALPVFAAAEVCSAVELCASYPCTVFGVQVVGDGCDLAFAGDVTIRGTLKSPPEGGGFRLSSPGAIVLDTGVLRSLGWAGGAGAISVEAGGAFRMLGAFSKIDTSALAGALDVDVTAASIEVEAGSIAAAGGSTLQCGDSGAVVFETTGAIVLNAPITTEAGANCGGGDVTIEGAAVEIRRPITTSGGYDGGWITIEALAGDLVVTSAAALRARGKYEEPDSAGDGGTLLLTAAGSITISGTIDVDGGSPNGTGGDIDMLADDTIAISGTLSSTGAGLYGSGGFVTLDAGGWVALSALIDLDGKGAESDGGALEMVSGGGFVSSATLRARGGDEGSGGDVGVEARNGVSFLDSANWRLDGGSGGAGSFTITTAGTASLAGELRAVGTSGLAGGGDIRVAACSILVPGRLDVAGVTGTAGTIVLRGGSVEIADGARLDANSCGTQACIAIEDRMGAVVIDPNAALVPSPLVTADPSLALCCGNAALETWEQCDDGNRKFCDGCTQTCTIEPACVPDGNECTLDCRVDLGCLYTPLSSLPCAEDGDLCTDDRCLAGSCTHSLITCDDGIDCTIDTCDPAAGCAAQGQDDLCDDLSSCTTDVCDTAAGCIVVPVSDGTVCDDGSICSNGDTCLAGACIGTAPPLDCDDGDACTEDLCDPAIGCDPREDPEACPCADATSVYSAGTPCVDGNGCTEGDLCDGTGTCKAGPACENADPCSEAVACFAGTCVFADTGCVSDCTGAAEGSLCSDGDLCTEGVCLGDLCVAVPSSCDDGDICNGQETCFANGLGCRQVSYGAPICAAADDAFLCYRARLSKGAPGFAKLAALPVRNAAHEASLDLKKWMGLCLPTELSERGAPATDDALEVLLARAPRGSSFARVLRVAAATDWGEFLLDLKNPRSVLVPAAVDPLAAALPSPPYPSEMLCYVAKISKGTAAPSARIGVGSTDLFGSLVLDVKAVKALCLPSDLDGADPDAAQRSSGFLCAKVRQAKGSLPFARREGHAAQSRFGTRTFDALRVDQLCVPATLTLPAP